ncbi:transglycosylase SLT domain protein [Clostridium botulinum CFSAN002367]|nr:transglycosylase SLT domain protein [Clostridium botulinum CFSAN002369]EPS51751.1 transglycosylase SLT domain protein [Clostridium botulinum CFSAN002367]
MILILTIMLLINITTIAKYIFPIKYRDYIDMYANEHKLDPYFVAAVIKTESNFKKDAASKKMHRDLCK